MKKVISVFLSLLLCFSCTVIAFADEADFTVDGDGRLTSYDGDEDKVVVPAGVKTLAAGVFSGKAMSEVVLPESLEVIEGYVFSECGNLKTVTIPKNVKEIGEFVFDYCPAMTGIAVAAGNQNYKSVNGVLFSKSGDVILRYPQAKSGTAYTVPDTVKTIEQGAFYGAQLASVTVGDNVEAIKCYSFQDCENLAEIKIGNGVKLMGDWVFGGDKKLTRIDLPASLEEFGTFVFDNCTGLTAINVAEGGEYYTSVNGVMYSKNMRTLVKYPEGKSAVGFELPVTVRRLAVGAFTRCDFTEIDLSNVTFIEMCGLNECARLKTVTLGAGLTEIEWGAFSHDEALQTVYYTGNESTWEEIKIDEGENGCLLNARLICTGGENVPHPSRVGEIGDPWRPEDLPPAGNSIFNGDWGSDPEDLKYSLDDRGTLTITGSGATYGYVTVEFQTGWWSPGMPLPTWSPLHAYKDDIRRVVLTGDMTVLGPNVFFECSRITDVYFDGTEAQWNALDIRDGNECLTGAVIHFRAPDPATCEHVWDDGVITVPATCTSTGEMLYFCSICGTEKTETIEKDPTNHTGETELKNAVEATCGMDGYTGDLCCKGCGAVLTPGEAIPATGEHVWDAGKVTTPPTCTGDGVKTYTCTVCKATATEVVNAAGHTPVTDKAVAATCTKDGKTAGSHCSVCGEILTAQTTVKAAGHQWDNGKVTKQPTQKAEGEKTFTCTVCGKTRTESIAKLPADPENPTDPEKPVDPGNPTDPDKPERPEKPVDPTAAILGDVDGDGGLTAGDARLALRGAVGLENYAPGSAAFTAADADKDGALTAGDARLILRAAVGLETLA